MPVQQGGEGLDVLDGEGGVGPELPEQPGDDGGIEDTFVARHERCAGGEMDEDEGEGDDREDDGDRGGEAPHQPRRHLTLLAVSIDLLVVGDAPGPYQRPPCIGTVLDVGYEP